MEPISEREMKGLACEHGFHAVFCLPPAPEDGLDKGVRTLALLVRAYTPGGALVDAFYTASNEAYHQACRLAERLSERCGAPVELDREVRFKRVCNRLPQFRQGRNTLHYLAGIGSRFCLWALDLPFSLTCGEGEAPRLDCASCRRCMEACPTGAIAQDGFHRERCLRARMLGGEPVPEAYRAFYGAPEGAMGVLGCDVCQRVCPGNASGEAARETRDCFTIPELLQCDEETRLRFAERYGYNYANRNRIQAQAVLAAANANRAEYLPFVQALKESASPVVLEHMLWALEKMKNLQF